MIWVLRPLRQADPRPSPQIWTHPQIDSIDVSDDFQPKKKIASFFSGSIMDANLTLYLPPSSSNLTA